MARRPQKLTPTHIEEIKKLLAQNVKQTRIAEIYGVSTFTINGIKQHFYGHQKKRCGSLTPTDHVRIKERLAEGYSVKSLAEAYNVSTKVIIEINESNVTGSERKCS